MLRPLHLGDLVVSGPGLVPDGPCPVRFSVDDRDETPTLHVHGMPEGTVELALVCHDPDAPRPHGFTHWVYALARTVEGEPTREEFLDRHADDVIEQARLVLTFERAPEA